MSYEVIVMIFLPKELIKFPSLPTMINELLWQTEIHTLAYEHTNLKIFNYKMSYDEIPNILVDSAVLPNKPLSNLEIIDAAKKLSLYEFRGVFLRDNLPKNVKLS